MFVIPGEEGLSPRTPVLLSCWRQQDKIDYAPESAKIPGLFFFLCYLNLLFFCYPSPLVVSSGLGKTAREQGRTLSPPPPSHSSLQGSGGIWELGSSGKSFFIPCISQVSSSHEESSPMAGSFSNWPREEQGGNYSSKDSSQQRALVAAAWECLSPSMRLSVHIRGLASSRCLHLKQTAFLNSPKVQ